MKIVKYISFIICMAIALVITSEVRVKYFISEIQMNNWSFHFDNNISEDIIDIMENLASKNNVIVYSKKKKVPKKVLQHMIFLKPIQLKGV